MSRSSTSHRKSKPAASAARSRRRRTRPPAPRDEPKFEKYFDYGEGHTARILTSNEVLTIAEGRYVPVTESKTTPRPAQVDSTAEAGRATSVYESFEITDCNGKVVSFEELQVLIDGR